MSNLGLDEDEAAYLETALDRGRPTKPCECEACWCELHCYPGDDLCLWCRCGDHDQRQICEECGGPVGEDGCVQSTPIGPEYYCAEHCPYGHDHADASSGGRGGGDGHV